VSSRLRPFAPSCLLLSAFCLLLSPSPLPAQTISNITLSYSCPCKVTATYDLDATKPTDVQLFYSPDKAEPRQWLPATIFPQKPAGTHTDEWDCSEDGASYGWFFFKLEPVVEDHECVWINGVCWATRNVDMPYTFADNPEDAGMFYQWNRNIGWSSTNPMVNSNGGTTWDNSTPPGTTWEPANDPSPPGYRVPTQADFQSLLNTTYVDNVWTTENGKTGRRFTDKTSGESIFLPAAGCRTYSGGTLSSVGTRGYYWSSTQLNAGVAYGLYFGSSDAYLYNYGLKTDGYSVRPVAE